MTYKPPDRMTDRWRHRPELSEVHGTVYWHLLIDQAAPVRETVATAQSTLSAFPDLHLTPDRWLHITIFPIGSRGDVSAEQLADLIGQARDRLVPIPPIPLVVGRVLYHPEAIAVAVRPRRALTPLFDIARLATRASIRRSFMPDQDGPIWVPHITLAYGTADRPAGPIIAGLGHDLPERGLVITSMSLVVQRGPEQSWNWEVIGTARLGLPDVLPGGCGW